MDANAAIQKLTFVADTSGIREVRGELVKLDDATTKTGKAASSLDREMARLETRIDREARLARQLTKDQELLNRAYSAGSIDLTRYNRLMGLAEAHNAKLAASATASTAALAAQGRALGALSAGGGALLGAVGLGGGIFAGVAAAGLTMRAFIKNTLEAQSALAQLEAAIASTGGAAGMTVADLTGLASEMQRLTTYGDDAVLAAEGLMLTFTKVGAEVFPDAIRSVLDMSTAMGTDLKSSVIQLGKALNDPIKGITALTRVGVTFTEAQKETITTLVETGRVADAQRLILKELQTEFGGSAAAARDTLGGALTALGNAFGDLFEVSREGTSNLVRSVNSLTDALSDPATITAIQDIGAAIFDTMAAAARDIVKLIEEIKAFAAVIDAVVAAARNIDFTPNFTIEQEYKSLLELSKDLNASEAVRAKAAAEAAKLYEQLGVTGFSGFRSIEAAAMAAYEASKRTADVVATIPPAAEAAGEALRREVDIPLPRLRPETDAVAEGFDKAATSAANFGLSVVKAFTSGEDRMAAMASTLNSLSDSLANTAIKDAISGNFAAAAVKGIGAVVSGIFGRRAEEEAERRREEKEAARQVRELAAAIREMGHVGGDLTNTLRDLDDRMQQLQKAARKADRDIGPAIDKINELKADAVDDFTAKFDTMIASLKSGAGFASDALEAANAIQALGASIEDFLKDAKKAGLSKKEAKAAGAEALLATFVPAGYEPPALNPFETWQAENARLSGQVDLVINELMDIGFSGKKATAMALGGLATGMAQALDMYLTVTKERQNDWTNRLLDLQADTSTLDGQLAEIDRQYLADLETEKKNGGEAIKQLDAYYGQLRLDAVEDWNAKAAALEKERLDAIAAQNEKALEEARSAARSRLDEARADLRSAYEAEASAINRTIDRMRSFVSELGEFRASLRLDQSLSILSPEKRYLEAQRQFRNMQLLASAGDEAAQAGLTRAAQSFLTESRSFNASNSKYASDFLEVERAIGNAAADAQNQLTIAEQQLVSLDRQVSELITINDSVLSVADAIRELRAAMGVAAGLGLNMGGMIPGFASGGMVGNGMWNRDSVLARYAGGGNIALSGGEFVARAPSVTPATLPVLQQINRTGQAPSIDVTPIVQAVIAASQAEMATTREEMEQLGRKFDNLSTTIRTSKNATPRPGGAKLQ